MQQKQKLIIVILVSAAVVVSLWSFRAEHSNTPKPAQEVTQAAIPVSPPSTKAPQASPSSPHQSQMQVSEPPAPASAEELEMELLLQEDPNPDYLTFGDRLQEVIARRDGKTIDPQRLWAASQQKEAWSSTDEPGSQLGLSDEERMDGREFIRINPLKIESLLPGDRMELSISQANQTYIAQIDQVVADEGRSVTWLGHLEGLENHNQVVFTRGDSLIVGGITTPEGHFALEAHNDQGWIANSATLFKGHDQEVRVPEELLHNAPPNYIELPTETFGHSSHPHKGQPPVM